MGTANKPDQLEKEIISILDSCLDRDFDEEEIKVLLVSTNGQFVESIFESYLQGNWECNLSTLHALVDRLNSLPCELIPINLFGAAMKIALSETNWEIIALHKDIKPKISHLRNTNASVKIEKDDFKLPHKLEEVVISSKDSRSLGYLFDPPTWITTSNGQSYLFSQVVFIDWNVGINIGDAIKYEKFKTILQLSTGLKLDLYESDRQQLLNARNIDIKLEANDGYIDIPRIKY